MQGRFSFPPSLAANWDDILDPGVDEETQTILRDKKAMQDRARRIQEARGGGQPADGAAQAQVAQPKPPSTKFTVKNTTFYILKGGASDEKPRAGIWGHYLVPYVIDAASQKARPFKESDEDNQVEEHSRVGDPGRPLSGTDKQPEPDRTKCKYGIDYVRATTRQPAYWEVGIHYIRSLLEKAEAMDLAFAQRMEGLGTIPRGAVWDCLDPDYDAGDREAVMTQFMSKYLERFYARQDPGNTPPTERVTEEALHKHKAFCKAWTQKHYKTLTPAVTAPAEALASDFYQHIEQHTSRRGDKLTTRELARIFMRHEEFAAEFAQALHFYSGFLEQSRGARNASYKQMRATEAGRVMSYKRFAAILESKWSTLSAIIRDLCAQESNFLLDSLTVDWYNILGQMPQVHKYFDEPPQFQGVASRMESMGGDILPPWLFSRDI
jgi:hypothetical protein